MIQLSLPGWAITVSLGLTTLIGPVEGPSSFRKLFKKEGVPLNVATPTYVPSNSRVEKS
jgi:hypothetical protein